MRKEYYVCSMKMGMRGEGHSTWGQEGLENCEWPSGLEAGSPDSESGCPPLKIPASFQSALLTSILLHAAALIHILLKLWQVSICRAPIHFITSGSQLTNVWTNLNCELAFGRRC